MFLSKVFSKGISHLPLFLAEEALQLPKRVRSLSGTTILPVWTGTGDGASFRWKLELRIARSPAEQ